MATRYHRFGLTDREMDVVRGVLLAHSNRRIAIRLAIAETTVKHHLAHIYAKVGVMTRVQLAMFAMTHQLIDAADTRPADHQAALLPESAASAAAM